MRTIPSGRLALSVPTILVGLLAIYVASLGFHDASQPKAASAVTPKDAEAEYVSVARDGCWPFPVNGDSSESTCEASLESDESGSQQVPTLAPPQPDPPVVTGAARFEILPAGRAVYVEVVAEQPSLEVGMHSE